MMDKYVNLKLIQADYADYPTQIENLQLKYLEYPRNVGIETQVKCNSKCKFCPYPISPRQGQIMSEDLFQKVIDDLTQIPRNHDFGITLHRINEPLLDRRMEGFCRIVAEKLPNANQQFWTNGTMLIRGAFEWITQYQNSTFTVSLNSVNEEEHKLLMGFGLKRVLLGLNYLHQLVESKRFNSPVTLCAPFFNEKQAMEFQDVCKRRWPFFNPVIRPIFQWMGESRSGSEYRASSLPAQAITEVPGFACGQWFDLHILANGYITKCCIDETGYDGNIAFDARERNVLEIYQNSQTLRLKLPTRSEVRGCEECLHLG